MEAIRYYRESIKVTSENKNKSVRQKDLILSYYFLGVFYGSLNNVSEKMKALDSCIAYARRLNTPSDIACVAALYQKVEYYFDIGDYQRCIEYAIMCEKFALEYASHETEKRNVEVGRQNAESSLLWRVKALLVLKEYDQAEKLLTNKLEEYKKMGLDNYFGTLYSQMAELQLHKENYKQANFFFNTSLKWDMRAGYNFNCKQTTKDIGYSIYFRHFKDYGKALIYYKKALGYVNREKARNVADVFESLNIFTLIANVYVRMQDYDAAFKYYQLALDQIKPEITENSILQSPPEEFIKHKKIYYLTELLLDKADAYKEQYQYTHNMSSLQEAIRIYRLTDQLLDKIKAEQTELESKLFWRSDTRRLFENAIEACFLQNNPKSAVYFFERSRAVLLNDQLREQRWLGENDIAKMALLNKKIDQMQRQLQTADESSVKNKELETDLFASTQDLDHLKKTIQISNPLYYQSFLDTNTMSFLDIQKDILRKSQTAVEIFSGDSAVYSLLMSSEQIQLLRINKTSYDSLVGGFISLIADAEKMNKSFDVFVSTSRSLCSLIFQNRTVPAGRTIIVPDGRYFPFEALVTSAVNEPVRYFLNDHAVSYTYSLRYLLNSFSTSKSGSARNFIGFAPMHFPYASNLSPLNGSDHSLKQAQSYFFRADNFIESNASKGNFLREFYKYRIIQLYTHASDTSNKGDPLIYFCDSILYLSDLIREKKPSTSLIVLSACETGNGKLYKGEGVFSFNRGFAAMGIPSSIITLWSVENTSTYKITELFYKYVARGLPIDIALQKAKVEFLNTAPREKRLPYYWAAPVLVGKNDAIEIQKAISWKIIALIIIATGLAAVFAYRVVKSK